MNAYPTELKLTESSRLLISWSDGERREYGVKELRDACPCATCREKRTEEATRPAPLFQVLSPEETRPLTLAGMTPVGNYAYSISFSDGHGTGIYTFERLRELGRREE